MQVPFWVHAPLPLHPWPAPDDGQSRTEQSKPTHPASQTHDGIPEFLAAEQVP